MTDTHILIVEDEERLARLLGDYLKAQGWQYSHVSRGDLAIDQVHEVQPDLLVLDLMLPGKDGLTLCREVRQFSQVPIIMLTARVEEIDRLVGLEMGADDYICKPFSPREVIARIKAVLRRSRSQPQAQSIRTDQEGLKLDMDRLTVIWGTRKVQLTVVEAQLLKTLQTAPGRIFSRQKLIDSIYEDHRVVSDRTVDSHIKKLRKKLDEVAPGVPLIQSVYGAGYRYDPPEF
jgi:two-component system response regulator BaeR